MLKNAFEIIKYKIKILFFLKFNQSELDNVPESIFNGYTKIIKVLKKNEDVIVYYFIRYCYSILEQMTPGDNKTCNI